MQLTDVTDALKNVLGQNSFGCFNENCVQGGELDLQPEHQPTFTFGAGKEYARLTIRFDAVYFTEMEYLVKALDLTDVLVLGGLAPGCKYRGEVVLEGYIHTDVTDRLLP